MPNPELSAGDPEVSQKLTQPDTACPQAASRPVQEAGISYTKIYTRNALPPGAVRSAMEEKQCVVPEQLVNVGQSFTKVSR